MSFLSEIDLDDASLPVTSPELEQERRVAVFDLREDNHFELKDGSKGPYRLRLGAQDGGITFDWQASDGGAGSFRLALGALGQAARDYRSICESYVDAVRTLPPARIEEIDSARREIHSEAARQLQNRLSDHVEVDEPTARRLFTLICAMDGSA